MRRKLTAKGIVRKNDKEWRDNIVSRDNYQCQVCGKKLEGRKCYAHHIIPRQFRETRWDILNGITLCYYHHKVGKTSPHQNALWFTKWLKKFKFEIYTHCMWYIDNKEFV